MIIVVNGIRVEVPVTSNYEFRESLMKDNLLFVAFELKDRAEFPIGSYVEVDNTKYVLLDNYEPQEFEGGFRYEMEFEHEFFKVKNKLFTYKEQVVETSWNIRADAMTVMQTVVDAINRELGVIETYAVDDTLVGTKLIEFNNVSIFDGLNKIAEAWNTEWWYDGVIHLGKASKGEPFKLEVGDNIGVPRVQRKDKQYTRFYAFGSERNIPQDYNAGANMVYAKKRLALPQGFIDVRPNLTIDEIVPYVVEFPDIYPRSQLEITNVEVEVKDYVESDGTIADKKIYYYTIEVGSFKLTQDLVLNDEVPQITFDSGVLVGETFDLNIDKGITIIYQEEGGWILPNATLRPQVGDKVIFSNIKMPQEYIDDAEAELERETLKLIEEKTEDNREFVVETNLNNTKELFVGDNVLLVNGDWSLNTRVIKREVSYEYPEIGTYTLSNFYQKGVFRELKEDINRISSETRLLNAMQIQAQYDANRLGNNSQRVNDFIVNYEKYGNIGILVYPAGVYDAEKEYVATEIERPMVEFEGGRYILNKQGTFKGVTPEDGDIWMKTTDFQAIYTQILFAEFAKLGSFVFSGDFMMSQFGYDNDGNLTQDYHNFPSNFRPVYKVNGKTGDVEMNDATINNAVLNNVYARGTIASQMARYNAEFGSVTIDFDKGYVSYLEKAPEWASMAGEFLLPKKVKQKHVNTEMLFVWDKPYESLSTLKNIPLLIPTKYVYNGEVYPIAIGGGWDRDPNTRGGIVEKLSLFVSNKGTPSDNPDELVEVNYSIGSLDANQFGTLVVRNNVSYIQNNAFPLPIKGSNRLIGKALLDFFPINMIIFNNTEDILTYELESDILGREIAFMPVNKNIKTYSLNAQVRECNQWTKHTATKVFSLSSNNSWQLTWDNK